MKIQSIRGICLVAVLGMVVFQAPVRAQFRFVPTTSPTAFNPLLGAGFSQAQYMNNLAAMSMTNPFLNPTVGPIYNPYIPSPAAYVNPYSPGASSSGFNPYSPSSNSSSSGYGGSMMPYFAYNIPPAGFFLMGAAQVMNAYPNIIKGNEEAWLLREQVKQAQIETRKKRMEYEIWLKANTPKWSEEQAKHARLTLKRLQTTSNPYEIQSGKALNILRDDLARALGKKISFEALTLSEEVLKHINVSRGDFNLGLLRNNGAFTWPLAFQELLTPEERKDIEFGTQELVQNAQAGDVPRNVLQKLDGQLEKLREKLVKKINDIPFSQYNDAKRFLNEFDAARLALEKGDAVPYFTYQKWTSGGKTVQELMDYMIAKGLRFAPAVAGDEGAYRSLYNTLAAYDVAFNAQEGGAPLPPSKESRD